MHAAIERFRLGRRIRSTSSCRAIVQRLSRLILLLAVAAVISLRRQPKPRARWRLRLPRHRRHQRNQRRIQLPLESRSRLRFIRSAPTFSNSAGRHRSAGQIHSGRGALGCWTDAGMEWPSVHHRQRDHHGGRRDGAGDAALSRNAARLRVEHRETRGRFECRVLRAMCPACLIALDHGAVEMSFAASTAREQNADTLLTPYFRIMIGGPNAADVRVRHGRQWRHVRG